MCHLKCFYIFSTLSDWRRRRRKEKNMPGSHFYQNIYIKFNFLHMLSHFEEIFHVDSVASSHSLINIIVVTLLPHDILFFSWNTPMCHLSIYTHRKFSSWTCKIAPHCAIGDWCGFEVRWGKFNEKIWDAAELF